MSTSEIVESILEHHGTKGMKWGHRKITNSSAFKNWSKLANKSVDRHNARASARTRKASEPSRRVRRADKKFEKKSSSLDTKIALNNAVTKQMNDHIARINTKYKQHLGTGVLLDRDNPVTKRYFKEYNDAAIKEMDKVASQMTNKSGTRQYKVVRNQDDLLGFTVLTTGVKKSARHADGDESFRVRFITDAKGAIVRFEIVDDSLTQSALIVDDLLIHFGKKGMKWGVRNTNRAGDAVLSRGFGITTTGSRKRSAARSGAQAVSVTDKRKKIKTSGGAGHPAHPDAVRAHTIGRVAKKSGTKALSNEELQILSRRMQLEQSVKQLSTNQKSAGQKFATGILKQSGNKVVQEVTGGATSQIKRHLTRRLAR